MNPRVVYFGTDHFAVPALRALQDFVTLVVSQPDRPKGRGLQMQPSPVKQVALELGLPVETPEKARATEFVERIQSENADLLVVAAYGQILSEKLLNSAKQGGINLHGSILPKYRGAAPIQYAILNGETRTGVTLMQMDKGMDTGDMIAVAELEIPDEATSGELAPLLAECAAQLVKDWLPRLAMGDYPRTPQNHEEATYAPRITKEEAALSVERTAEAEHRRVRAFTPSPGAFLQTRQGLLRIQKCRLCAESGPPGTFIGRGIVAFAEGSLELLEVRPEGKKVTTGQDLMNGWRLRVGDSILP